MKYVLILALLGSITNVAFADLEIKGKPDELTTYLANAPKTVNVSGESELKVQADRAYVTLQVNSDGKSLAESLQKNQQLRDDFRNNLVKRGIPAERIFDSKYSSVPEVGSWTGKVRSYRTENHVKVMIQGGNEFQSIADSIENKNDVILSSFNVEDSKAEEHKQKVAQMALENALQRKQLFEKTLKVGLTLGNINSTDLPVRNANNQFGRFNSVGTNTGILAGENASRVAMGGTSDSLGELIYAARFNVEYQIGTDHAAK